MKRSTDVSKEPASAQKIENQVKFTYAKIDSGNLKDMPINQAFAAWLETESNASRKIQLFSKEKN